jgi:hypothetical protein
MNQSPAASCVTGLSGPCAGPAGDATKAARWLDEAQKLLEEVNNMLQW